MGILRRRAPAEKAEGDDTPLKNDGMHRIEITVERETVSILVRGRAAAAQHDQTAQPFELEGTFQELPPVNRPPKD
jgi:hypothetical protein